MTSPAAKRTYLRTVLFLVASLALLGVAALAYPLFYYSYVPKKVVSIPVHLQYKYVHFSFLAVFTFFLLQYIPHYSLNLARTN